MACNWILDDLYISERTKFHMNNIFSCIMKKGEY